MSAFKGDSIFWIETSKIVPNPYQPRREFDEARLKELADSIRMYGVLQPLTVSRKEVHNEDGAFRTEYELIAGERRLRASKLANVEQVPVIIREGDDSEQEKLELAIIENLQREDLNAVDRALAFKQLADMFDLSHAQVATKVGRSREYVSNSIRLLNLPEYILDSVKTGDISEGHARTLLMLNDRPEELDTLYRETLMKKLTVREVERIARKIATDKVRKQQWKGSDPELIEKEKQFTETLGTRVQLTKTDYGGKITIDYFSDEDLDVLLTTLAQQKADGYAVPDISPVTSAAAATQASSNDALDTLHAATPLTVVTEPDTTPDEEAPTIEADKEDVLDTPVEPEAAAPTTSEPTESPAESIDTLATETTSEPTSQPQPETVSPSGETGAEPAAPAAGGSSSLRSKLAQLFADGSAPTAPVAEPVTPAPSETPPVAPEIETKPAEDESLQNKETAEANDVAAAESAPPAPKKSDDDDDLYGLKNFSI